MGAESEPLLVPVEESITLRQTVAYAVDRALEADPHRPLHFVHIVPQREITAAGATPDVEDDLLEMVAVWAQSDAGESDVEIETARLGSEAYLFSASDYAAYIRRYAHERDIEWVVLDPEYDPGVGAPILTPLQAELARDDRLRIEEAPVEPATRRARLRSRASPGKYIGVFGVSYLFYLVLGGFHGTFDYVTGAITASLVALSLSRITFIEEPHPVRSAIRLLRSAVYVVYLFWEIVKANFAIAYVILDPRLTVDPRLTEVRMAVWEDLPITSLANSITLTPGTLSVRVRGPTFVVHTLTPSAREDLFDGGLERAIRFVFYGRSAARIASPRERDDARIVDEIDTGAGHPREPTNRDDPADETDVEQIEDPDEEPAGETGDEEPIGGTDDDPTGWDDRGDTE